VLARTCLLRPWHCVLPREEFDGSRPELQLMQTCRHADMQTCMHRGVLQRPSAALGGVPLTAQVSERDTAMRQSIGQRARCSETLVEVR
jgi:hypothetical protein